MRAVIFFLFLCFFLLRPYNYVYAEVHHNRTCYSSAHHIEKSQQTKFENTNKDFPVIKNHSLNEKKEDFISVENEDEDLASTGKYVLLTKYFITLSYIFILSYFYNYFKNRLPSCWHLSYTSSYKYILERVLRI